MLDSNNEKNRYQLTYRPLQNYYHEHQLHSEFTLFLSLFQEFEFVYWFCFQHALRLKLINEKRFHKLALIEYPGFQRLPSEVLDNSF